MKYKNIFSIFILLFIILTFIFIFFGIRHRTGKESFFEFKADGIGMVHTTYDKENKKSIEIECSESNNESSDKILMKDIKATVFKKGKMKEDLRILGDNGYVVNNFNNFFVENNARIVSKSFTIRSKEFLLKDRNIVSTEKKVNYTMKTVNGIAEKGLRLNINKEVLSLFETNGTYKKDEKIFDYRSKLLRLYKKEEVLRLTEENEIQTDQSILKGDIIIIQLKDDLKIVESTTARGNSYLYMFDEDSESKDRYNEIKSNSIQSFYNADGKVEKSEIRGNSKILLKSESRETRIFSDWIEIYFDIEAGTIKRVKVVLPGNIKSTGKSDFDISADRMNLDFEKGEINYCETFGNSRFKTKEYNGESNSILYYIDKNIIRIKGGNSKIKSKKNTFTSSGFHIRTKEKVFSASEGVKSVIISDEQNALFSKDWIYVNSKKITVLYENSKISYEGGVRLLQEDTVLKAKKLEIGEENNIEASGEVSLSFKNADRGISLKGDRIIFDSKKRLININGKAMIKSDDCVLGAKHLKIEFNEKNKIKTVYGEGEISFKKEKISGSSERVNWLFEKDMIIFRGSSQIKKTSGGVTEGKELRFDLKNDKITVISDEDKRSKTIIE